MIFAQVFQIIYPNGYIHNDLKIAKIESSKLGTSNINLELVLCESVFRNDLKTERGFIYVGISLTTKYF